MAKVNLKKATRFVVKSKLILLESPNWGAFCRSGLRDICSQRIGTLLSGNIEAQKKMLLLKPPNTKPVLVISGLYGSAFGGQFCKVLARLKYWQLSV